MSDNLYTRYEEAGLRVGYLLLDLKKNHNKIWIKLWEGINHNGEICLFGFIFTNIWIFVFGPLAPAQFPFGMIKNILYGFITYIIGFEFGSRYNHYVWNTVHIVYDDKNVKAYSDDMIFGSNDTVRGDSIELKKFAKVKMKENIEITYDKERRHHGVIKDTVFKKRRNSDSELDKKNIPFVEYKKTI